MPCASGVLRGSEFSAEKQIILAEATMAVSSILFHILWRNESMKWFAV